MDHNPVTTKSNALEVGQARVLDFCLSRMLTPRLPHVPPPRRWRPIGTWLETDDSPLRNYRLDGCACLSREELLSLHQELGEELTCHGCSVVSGELIEHLCPKCLRIHRDEIGGGR